MGEPSRDHLVRLVSPDLDLGFPRWDEERLVALGAESENLAYLASCWALNHWKGLVSGYRSDA